MVVYLVLFSVFLLIVRLSGLLKSLGLKSFSSILLMLGAVILCAFAGIRDIGVGTDTVAYAESLYVLANNTNNIILYLNSAMSGQFNMEPLFALAVYYPAKAGSTHFAYYFFIELMIVAPVIYLVRHVTNGRHECLVLFFYLMIFFPLSLSTMRQSVAMSFVLLSYMFVIKGNKIPALLFQIVAFGFHKTSIIGLIPLIVVFLLIKRDSHINFRKSAKIITVVIISAACVSFVFSRQLISFIGGMLGGYEYTYNNTWEAETGIAYYLLYGCILVCIFFIGYRLKILRKPGFLIAYIVAIFALPLHSLGLISSPLLRLGTYALLYSVFALGYALNQSEKNQIKYLDIIFLALLLFVQFWWFYDLNGANEVIPYSSLILGIEK